MGWRRRGGVALGAAVLSAGVVGGLAAPASAALPARTSPPPACATAVAYSSGTTTSAPVPLPPPASAAGGTRLAQPGLQVQLERGTPAPPRLKASAWIVADLGTGNVIAACNAHVPLAPASTLKVLTALALRPRIDRDARYLARPQDAAVDGTKVGLVPGSVYTADNLWHGLLMGSGNDAATALATLVGGTPAAAALMASTARSLGARDTVVANTSGLDAPGQVSSVYDLALFGRALLRDPALAGIVRTTTYPFPAAGKATGKGGGRKTYQIQNHNRLLLSYPGTTGIKNGYTSAAGASLVASATRGGRSYVVVMLRSDVDVWGIGRSLFDWAFAQNGGADPVGRLDGTPAPPGAATPATVSPNTGSSNTGSSSTGSSNTGSSSTASSSAVPSTNGPQSSAGSTSASRNRYATAPAAVPPAIGGPVRSALQTLPEGWRTVLLLAVLALALAGGTMVRRVALARSAPRSRPGTKGKGRTPTKRSPAARSRPASKRPTTTARRPTQRRSR